MNSERVSGEFEGVSAYNFKNEGISARYAKRARGEYSAKGKKFKYAH